eukprot:scaffold1696_cov258-Pinguiococcus_pyrenoidosus.AAC.30
MRAPSGFLNRVRATRHRDHEDRAVAAPRDLRSLWRRCYHWGHRRALRRRRHHRARGGPLALRVALGRLPGRSSSSPLSRLGPKARDLSLAVRMPPSQTGPAEGLRRRGQGGDEV